MRMLKEFFAGEFWQKLRALRLPEKGAMLGGVCEALGGVTPLAPWMWRALFCVVALAWGSGLFAYFILWAAIPDEEPAKEQKA